MKNYRVIKQYDKKLYQNLLFSHTSYSVDDSVFLKVISYIFQPIPTMKSIPNKISKPINDF